VKLATRLSLFFQVLLAVVLVGFSATLYLLARTYLHGQAEERLQAAVNTLIAAVEIRQDGVEWEPAERTLTFQTGAGVDPILWLISDNQGRVVDRVGAAATEQLLAEVTIGVEEGHGSSVPVDWHGRRWQFTQRWLGDRTVAASRSHDREAANEERQPPETRYPALAITTGISLEAMYSTLWWLAWALAAVSLAVWFLALILGRAVCRQALRPVTRLAYSARAMNATDAQERLPVSTTRDELEDLSRSFNGLLDRLHESFERQRRFTGDASHQLRTPLTALLGQLEVALRRERRPEEYREVLVAVQKQGMHLRRIIESLLFLARADAEARLPNLETVSLAGWLAHHLDSWSGHARFRDIRLEGEVGTPLDVAAQPVLLGELVNILIENACKYSQLGTSIVLRLGRQADNVFLSVDDRGSGMSKEELPHIGEPFFRSAEARRRGIPGVGLGLAIAKRLAEAQAGSLAVASEYGTGCTFTVLFPPRTQRDPLPGAERLPDEKLTPEPQAPEQPRPKENSLETPPRAAAAIRSPAWPGDVPG
jgi:heavy metal sensor kinase